MFFFLSENSDTLQLRLSVLGFLAVCMLNSEVIFRTDVRANSAIFNEPLKNDLLALIRLELELSSRFNNNIVLKDPLQHPALRLVLAIAIGFRVCIPNFSSETYLVLHEFEDTLDETVILEVSVGDRTIQVFLNALTMAGLRVVDLDLTWVAIKNDFN